MQRGPDVNGTLILILGIVGLVICPCLSFVSWSMGHNALKELDSMSVYDGSERTMANIGRILGIIGAFVLLGRVVLHFLLRSA